MAYKVLIPQNISTGGKNYLKDRGYEIALGTRNEIDVDIVGEFDAILLRTAVVNGTVLDAAKKLKVIGRHGVGLDNIDMGGCKKRNIRVTCAPYANIVSVAEYTLLMILQCAKNTYEVETLWRSPENDFNSRNTCCGIELIGRTLGIIGTGKIGSLVAKKVLSALEMNIIAYDSHISEEKHAPGIRYVNTLNELLEQSDFVTLHVPLNEETFHLIGADQLSRMKKSAYLINAARGAVVDEPALIKALKEGQIAGAALDVFENEPHVWPNPLFEMNNVIVSPHTAGMTVESSDRVGIHAAMGIDDVLSGREPQWPADRTDAEKTHNNKGGNVIWKS
jgi:D-3-phosphoglycerate dehydrogenase